jgi:hypothetical protein
MLEIFRAASRRPLPLATTSRPCLATATLSCLSLKWARLMAARNSPMLSAQARHQVGSFPKRKFAMADIPMARRDRVSRHSSVFRARLLRSSGRCDQNCSANCERLKLRPFSRTRKANSSLARRVWMSAARPSRPRTVTLPKRVMLIMPPPRAAERLGGRPEADPIFRATPNTHDYRSHRERGPTTDNGSIDRND